MQRVLSDIGNIHWYLRGNVHICFEIVKFFLLNSVTKEGRTIVDIGPGPGYLAMRIEKYGKIYIADNAFESLINCKKQGLSKALQSDAKYLPFHSHSFTAVTMFDVIEHIDDDCRAVKEAHRILKKKGYLFIRVPAHNILWGRHDNTYGHLRRYSKRSILDLMIRNNFSIVKFTYLHPFLLFNMAVVRFLDRLCVSANKQDDFKMPPKPINQLLYFFLRIEAELLKKFNFPFGISILCVAKKE